MTRMSIWRYMEVGMNMLDMVFNAKTLTLVLLTIIVLLYRRMISIKRQKELATFYDVYSRKDFDTALWLINQYVDNNTKDAFGYMLKGSVLKDLERMNAAIRSLKEAVMINVKLFEAHKLLIEIYMSDGCYKEAEAHFNQGVKLQKTNFVMRFNRGINYMHLEDYRAAIKDFHYVEKRVNGNKKYIYDELALAYKNTGDMEQYSKYALLSGSY